MSAQSSMGIMMRGVLLLVLLTPLVALPQSQSPSSKFPIAKQPPIPFKKFDFKDIQDPVTHQPITPTSQVQIKSKWPENTGRIQGQTATKAVTPTTKTLSGEKLLDRVNKLEQHLNALGYTLRNKNVKMTIPSILRKDVLASQHQRVSARYHPYRTAMPFKSYSKGAIRNVRSERAKALTLKARTRSQRLQIPGAAPSGVSTGEGSTELSNEMSGIWNFLRTNPKGDVGPFDSGILGQQDLFTVQVKGSIVDSMTASALSTSIHYDALASIFTIPVKVLSIAGQAEFKHWAGMGPDRPTYGSLTVTDCMGIDNYAIISPPGNFANGPVEGTYNAPRVDKAVSYGPIDMGVCELTVKAGFLGSVVVEYSLYSESGYAQALITPHVNLGGSMEALVGESYAGFGVGIGPQLKLTFLGDDMELGGTSGVGVDGAKPYLFTEKYANDDLHALNGSMAVCAEVDYVIGSAQTCWDIFDWDGITQTGYIVDPMHTTYDLNGVVIVTPPLVLGTIQPVVNSKTPTVYDGSQGRPKILFEAGDLITITAGGCVQTGGKGKTWKRYVNPSGPNADRLYFGTIQIAGVTSGPGPVPIKSLPNIVPGHEPDVFTITFNTRFPDGLPEQQRYLTLGYVDDAYSDNGYYAHDNGTEDQCKNCDHAWVKVSVLRLVK